MRINHKLAKKKMKCIKRNILTFGKKSDKIPESCSGSVNPDEGLRFFCGIRKFLSAKASGRKIWLW